LTAGLAALSCLALTAGGTPPPSLPPGFAIEQTRAWFVFDDTGIYLVTDSQAVTAYDFEGRVKWRAGLPHEVNYVHLQEGPVAVLDRGDCSRLTRLDPATGRPLWTRTGTLVGWTAATDGADRILRRTTDCPDGEAGNQPDNTDVSMALDMVDRASGTVRRSVPIPAGAQWTLGWDSDTMGTWDTNGHLVETELATGAVLGSGDIPGLAGAYVGPSSMSPTALLSGDVWLVLNPPSLNAGDTEVVVSAHRRRTLDPLWTVRLPAAPPDVHQYYHMWPCEPAVVCVQLGEREEVPLDVATGARRPVRTGEYARIGAHWSVVPGADNTRGDNMTLRDERTGRIPFPGWRVQNITRPDDEVLVLTRPGAKTTEFALFDGHTGRLRVLGAAPGVYSGCEVSTRHLFCADDRLVLHVWPLTR
jgi:hypothetical protein